jgi:hypothetical protein
LIEAQFWKDDGPKTRTRHFYDSSGRPIRTVAIEADGIERESERFRYDSAGPKTKVEFLPAPAAGVDMLYAVDGSEQSYGVHGATTSTTTYDEHDLPNEVQFHDATHTLVHTIVFTRDRDGRVLTEEGRFAGATPFGNQMAETFKNASEEDRAKLAALMAVAFPDQTFTRTSYEYDQKGRRLAVTRDMGAMGGERTTFVYDDHDNVVEETAESSRHIVSLDDDGNTVEKEEPTLGSRTRLEYRYDTRGNWTEKVVSARTDQDHDFRRWNVERRVITYY